MYGPGKDWVGIERIPRDTVMGYWKYWSDYAGIDGLARAWLRCAGHLGHVQPHVLPGRPVARAACQTVAADGADRHAQHRGDVAAGRGGCAQAERMASSGASPPRRSPSTACGHSIRSGTALHSTDTPPGAIRSVALDEYQAEFTQAFVRHFYDAQDRRCGRLACARVHAIWISASRRLSWPIRRSATWSALSTRRNRVIWATR